jgi:hypothetical protein
MTSITQSYNMRWYVLESKQTLLVLKREPRSSRAGAHTQKHRAQRPVVRGFAGLQFFLERASHLQAAPKHSINPSFLRTSNKHLSKFIYCMIPSKHPKESSWSVQLIQLIASTTPKPAQWSPNTTNQATRSSNARLNTNNVLLDARANCWLDRQKDMCQ